MLPQTIIFTDLDGTLLDAETYSVTAALPGLEKVRERGVPLVFCTSKTRAEIEPWRERVGNQHPFICENGAGIFVPRRYFSATDVNAVWPRRKTIDGYTVLILGTPYAVLRAALKELRGRGFDVRGFGDLSAVEVAEITGLSREEARLAKCREFDEPFILEGDAIELGRLRVSVEEMGLRHAEGRLFHLMGDNDKGKAVEILKKLYRQRYGDIVTIGLGDSPVDFPMLECVDYPVLVRNYKGEHDPRIALPNLIKTGGIGPEGWNEAVLSLIQE